MKQRCRILFLALLWLLLGLTGCAKKEAAPAAAPPASPAAWEFSAVATPEPAPPPTPEPSRTPEAPTPEPDPLTARNGQYTIAWLSDTQHYSAKFPDVFYEMTQFLYAERARLNLKYVVHTGDLIHNFTVETQWIIADGAMLELRDIPYGVLAGNHDVTHDEIDYSKFGQYFGEARFQGAPWYGGSYENNRCHYDRIDAGQTRYLFVYVGYPATPESLAWADSVFRANPDCAGFLCVHDYMERGGSRTEQGELIFQSVVAKNPNVYFVLCGHQYDALCITAFLDDGGERNRTVYQIINNYQAAGDEGGSGYLRFFQVDEARGVIQMETYSPLMRDYVYFDEPGTQDEKYPADPSGETLLLDIPWQ